MESSRKQSQTLQLDARRSPLADALPYVLPFAVFICFLALNSVMPVPQWARFLIEAVVILAVSRPLLRAPSRPLASIGFGAAVFVIWIAPDLLIPAYRSLPLFANSIVGHAVATTTEAQKRDGLFLVFRMLNSVIAIPILEELFWRGFLMRWLIARDFRSVPLGKFAADAFWIVALLFASEHGPYWDVGLLAGAAYNWWIVRTRNLTDCIVAHAVTNLLLGAYVIAAGQWQFWM